MNKKQGLAATLLGCTLLLGACQGGQSDPLADKKYKIEDTSYSISFDGKDQAKLSWTDGAPNDLVKESTPFDYEIKHDNGKDFLVLKRKSDGLPDGYKDEFHFYDDKSTDLKNNVNCVVYEIKKNKKKDIKLLEKDVSVSGNDIELDKKSYKHPDKTETTMDVNLTEEE
ncbi:hypothetical protein [Staphylococcus caprae]|uniref:hypothetical protein n=1 Tax=Staphylococcus caprae TaxID=29380 RepID=UPI000CD198CF|nr:hypothetical protein [Staphylococcus caprae]POA06066.1 hypothetical protein CD155_03735 [Staphylococcus caprae]SUL89870.1 Uncharacterised protein [Staphylococcus caprae]